MKNLIRFDWAVKRLLRNKANFKVVEGFLSELLNEDIKIESILESESNQRYYDDKFNRFDEKAKDTLDEWIYYFKTNKIEENFTAKGLKEAKEILKEDNLPKKEISSYKRYLEDLRYQASMVWSMKIEAKDKIKKDRDFEIAKSIKADGFTSEIIKKHTGLSIEEIENLK